MRESLNSAGIRRGVWIHRILAGIEFNRAGWPGEIAAALDALGPSDSEKPAAEEAGDIAGEGVWENPSRRPGSNPVPDASSTGNSTSATPGETSTGWIASSSTPNPSWSSISRPAKPAAEFAGGIPGADPPLSRPVEGPLSRPARPRRAGVPGPGPDRGGGMSSDRVRLVPPRESLIAAVAACLPREGRDFSRSWVVFPERRPAYYLRKLLAERVGAGFIPPADFFARRVHGPCLRRAARPPDAVDRRPRRRRDSAGHPAQRPRPPRPRALPHGRSFLPPRGQAVTMTSRN